MIKSIAAMALAIVASAGAVWAQDAATDYPNKPIRLIVPFAPGGGTDTVARMIAQELSTTLGQQVVVENMAGGGTVIGTEAAVHAEPDGYTLLLGSTTLSINPGLRDDLPYDTLKDLQPVSMVSRIPYIMVTGPSGKFSSVGELLELSKADPGVVNVGSPGIGSGGHLAAELFESLAGIDMTHIPYSGNGPAITDLLGGQIDLIFVTAISVSQHIEAGTLTPIAVSIKERVGALPDVPTVDEAGVAGYESSSWNSILAPAGTPEPIVTKLNEAIREAVTSDKVRSTLEQDGAMPYPTSPEDFSAFLEGEIEKWRTVIEAAGIEAE